MSGLFGTLNIGKSGMFAQQAAITTTSHNIAAAKTKGYSRQRVEIETTRPYCKPSMNSTAGPGQVGTGVEIAAINRVRDSFLDYQVRVELGIQGQFASRNKYLSQIENMIKEPTDSGIATLFDNVFKSWQDLALNPQTTSAKSVVAEQSVALANEFNHTYNELSKLKETTQMEINNTVIEVNTILNQVNQLNQEIMQVKIANQQPNDLMDRRDLLLDQLSEKFGIEIEREEYEGTNVTTSNHSKDYQNKTSPFGGEAPYINYAPPAKTEVKNLVQRIDPDKVARFSYISEIKPPAGKKAGEAGDYTVTYYKDGDKNSDKSKRTITVSIASEEEFKRLDECRALWTDGSTGDVIKIKDNGSKNEADNVIAGTIANGGKSNFKELKLFEPPSGELRGQMSVQQDIDKYQGKLNNLAKSLAFSVNAIHTQNNKFDDKELNLFVNAEDPNNEKEITAQNIAVNKIIKDDPMKIITGVTDKSGEGDGKRALAIAQLKDALLGIQKLDTNSKLDRENFLTNAAGSYLNESDEYTFKDDKGVVHKLKAITQNTNGMTMHTYFNGITGSIGIQEQEAQRMIKNQKEVLGGFEQARQSVSGVALDEEFTNLVQFNHCYQANAKIISTVDQLLDVVINGLKR